MSARKPTPPFKPMDGRHFNCTRYPVCRNVPTCEDANGCAWCVDHAAEAGEAYPVLKRIGTGHYGKGAYAWGTFRAEWSEQQGARSCWKVWDTAPLGGTSPRLRADSLDEVRETMEGMYLEKRAQLQRIS